MLTTIKEILTADQFSDVVGAVTEAAVDLAANSGYMGIVGTGDEQKIAHVMSNLPAYDFEWEHSYGTVYGLLLAVSLGRAEDAGYSASGIVDMITDMVKDQS